ncbi:MAG: ThuA domain-containing protein [Pseudomonadales bacterium]|nr:ThuA domain-containing protein [Pseudomonadales bacterium]
MNQWLRRLTVVLLLIILSGLAYAYYQMRSRGFWRIPVFDTVAPTVPELKKPAVLVFSKTNSFIHTEAIPAAEAMFETLAKANGWSIFTTENGAIHNALQLAKFDVVVWNNVTGNVLTDEQRKALSTYMAAGGGWIGIHGAGDKSAEADWPWYRERLIGATFIGHPMDPQFQEATIHIEAPTDRITRHLGNEWVRTDEWYSFDRSPRQGGMTILGNLDESTYSPMFFGKDIRMGTDHPIMWKTCIGAGRAFYTAMGHTAETFQEPKFITTIARAVAWAGFGEGDVCSVDAR